MDEPTSALDPISTSKIEDLVMDIKKDYTIVMVTHNMQQAVRVSDTTVFFLLGEIVESGATGQMFSMPKDKRTGGLHHRPVRLKKIRWGAAPYPDRNLRFLYLPPMRRVFAAHENDA